MNVRVAGGEMCLALTDSFRRYPRNKGGVAPGMEVRLGLESTI